LAQSFRSGIDLRRRLQRLCRQARPSVFFYTDTGLLTESYRDFTGCQEQFVTLPVPPIQEKSGETNSVRRQHHPERTLRLGYMGGPRLDKGFDLLPWLYKRLPAQLAGRAIRLIIQTGPVTDADAELVVRSLTAFSFDPERPELEFFESPDSARYCDIFAGLDVVFLLYAGYRYRFSSSGIFVEAVQYGKPVLTFTGSWAAGLVDTAAKSGLSIGLSINKLAEAPAAMERIAGDIAGYQKDMETFRKCWLPEQNIRRVARSIAGNAGLSPAL
jgi:hypothetical protein